MSCQDKLLEILPNDKKSEVQYLEAIRWLLPPGFIWGFIARNEPLARLKDTISNSGNATYADNPTGTGVTTVQDSPTSGDTPGISANTKFGALFSAIASEIFRFQDRWYALYRESIPGLSQELLGEWESLAGLPDSCSLEDNRTIEERQCDVHAKIFANHKRGMTRQFYIDYAATLGFVIDVQEFTSSGNPNILAPVGVDPFDIGMRLGASDGARFVKKGNQSFVVFEIISGPTDPEKISFLQCTMDKLKPAHVVINWVV